MFLPTLSVYNSIPPAIKLNIWCHNARMKPGFETMEDTAYSIRAEGFGAVDVLLEELKIEPARAFALAGIGPTVLQDSHKNDLVDYRKFLGLLNHCAELSGRPDFGNLLSRYQDMTIIGLPGHAMYEARNFRAALTDLINFFHLHMNGMKVDFQQHGRTSLVSLQVIMPFPPNYRQQIELSLGIGLRFVRRLLGDNWCPNALFLEHREDSGAQSTRELFRCPVNFDSEFNGFTIDSASLDIEKAQFNSEAHRILYDYMCWQTRAVRRDFIIDVREQLIKALREGNCSIDAVGGNLGLSRRTLQRRLEDCGYLYSDLLEQTRMDLAQRYLRSSRIRVTQISNILCYSDISSFSRSFRRFCGVSPRIWRKRNAS
jgi:AraC-like DNA-binding protein